MLDVKYLEHQLNWLIKLRWIAIIGALVLAAAVRGSGLFDFQPALLYGVLGFSALGNLLFAWTLHRFRSRLIALALLQIFFDQVTLGVLLRSPAPVSARSSTFFYFTW